MSNAELVIAQETNLKLESYLESWLENSPGALAQDELILWIGRQTSAATEEGTIFPDLLGVDSEGNLVIVELKRDRTPRDVVAQLLEYAAWANELSEAQVQNIAEDYLRGKEKNFREAFRETFDVSDEEEIPTLNRRLRLFVVAEEIRPDISRVCRFLRTSYGMDISCIVVSTFKTKSGEVLVSTEAIVGYEGVDPTARRQPTVRGQWAGDEGVREVVLKAVRELTGGDTKREFTRKEVHEHIAKRYPNFNKDTAGAQITAGCPNHSSYHHHRGDYKYYWQIRRGVFCLYDPERDNVHTGK